MRNGEEGVSYRLVFLNGTTVAKSVNFVNGEATDSSAFSTEGNYTIALVAGNVVLQQYANIRVGNPPAQTYPITSSIRNNPGSSVITMTVDGNVVASGSQVAEGKTVHVEVTNATDMQALTVNNATKSTTLQGTTRICEFTMPSANTTVVATFPAPPATGIIRSVEYGDPDVPETTSDPEVVASISMSGGSIFKVTFVNDGGTSFAWRKGTAISGKVAIASSPQSISIPSQTGTYDFCVLDSNDEVIETFGTWNLIV